MKIFEWAARWKIPMEAVQDFCNMLGTNTFKPLESATFESSEAGVQSRVRLEASQKGVRLWRNNLGAVTTNDGRFIRFGLANDSSNLNAKIKSADLIGIKPVVIKAHMIGWTIGQFVSREIKVPTWQYSGTDREKAQLAWAELIASLGGDACFAVGEGTF